ncbi:Uncharacterised protein [uncultured archaeon]|nr:Uncharacterised protein [uncultured archaeon]
MSKEYFPLGELVTRAPPASVIPIHDRVNSTRIPLPANSSSSFCRSVMAGIVSPTFMSLTLRWTFSPFCSCLFRYSAIWSVVFFLSPPPPRNVLRLMVRTACVFINFVNASGSRGFSGKIGRWLEYSEGLFPMGFEAMLSFMALSFYKSAPIRQADGNQPQPGLDYCNLLDNNA